MTREEAIDRLKEARAGHKEFLSVETLNMAIKALEQEPCEDAISRQAVIDEIEKLKKIHFDRTVVLNKVRDRIIYLPSVQPKQETGHWIDKEIRGSIEPHCSECGCGLDVIYHYKYCPNCGRKMEV